MPSSITEIDKILTKRILEYTKLDDDNTLHPDAIVDHLKTDYPRDYERRKAADLKRIVTGIYNALKVRKEKGLPLYKPDNRGSNGLENSNPSENEPPFGNGQNKEIQNSENGNTFESQNQISDNQLMNDKNDSDSSELEIIGSEPAKNRQILYQHPPQQYYQNVGFPPSGQPQQNHPYSSQNSHRTLIDSIDKRKRKTVSQNIPQNSKKRQRTRKHKNTRNRRDSSSSSSNSDSENDMLRINGGSFRCELRGFK